MDQEPTLFAAMVGKLFDDLDSPHGDAVVVRWTDGRSGPADAHGWDQSMERMLVESACAGDDDALDVLLRREWYGVYRLVTAAEPAGDAENLVEEVFTRTIADLGQLRDLGVPLRSSLAQIARRLLRERAAGAADGWQDPANAGAGVPGAFRRAPAVDVVVVGSGEVPAGGPVPEPAEARHPPVVLLCADDRPLLVAALDRLPRHCRQLLWLRVVEGRSESEIGVDWGRSPESVRELQREALVALRATLTADETS
ncbi:MAG: RNA polymerase sigma factor [Acidimicrobiales bacterium]